MDMDREGQEYTGMTEEEFDAMYPNAGQGGDDVNNFGIQDQKEDVKSELSPADFEDANGHADESMHQGEINQDQTGQDSDIDERGVPWKQRAKEYERKLKELEAKKQQPSVPEPQPQQQVELPPQMPPQQQFPQQSQQWQSQSQIPTPEQLGYIKPEKVETFDDYIQLARYATAQDVYKVRQEAREEALQTIQQKLTEEQIYSEYPEMLNQQSPLFQWWRYEMATRYGNDPRFIEDAVMRSASRLNIQPKSRQIPQPQPQPQQKPLPKVPTQPPASERGTPARQQERKPKLPERSLRAAKFFGQKPSEIEAMIKRQKYAFVNGESLFE